MLTIPQALPRCRANEKLAAERGDDYSRPAFPNEVYRHWRYKCICEELSSDPLLRTPAAKYQAQCEGREAPDPEGNEEEREA